MSWTKKKDLKKKNMQKRMGLKEVETETETCRLCANACVCIEREGKGEGEIDGVSRLKTFLSDSLPTPAAHQTKANEQTGEKCHAKQWAPSEDECARLSAPPGRAFHS